MSRVMLLVHGRRVGMRKTINDMMEDMKNSSEQHPYKLGYYQAIRDVLSLDTFDPKVYITIFMRYKLLLLDNPFESDIPKTDSKHLIWVCEEVISHIGDMEVAKINRWLGYVQGVCIMRGLCTVDGERDYTRALFKKNKKVNPN